MRLKLERPAKALRVRGSTGHNSHPCTNDFSHVSINSMRSFPLALILGLCACATGSPPAKKAASVNQPALPASAEIIVTCDPKGSDRVPKGFGFADELAQGEPTCRDCLVMADTIESLCQDTPQYCPCLQHAFSKNCGKYFGQIRQGCPKLERNPVPVSGPLVEG